jgi:hypothetical protein
MRFVWWLCLLAACGRFGFDSPTGGGDGGGSNVDGDGGLIVDGDPSRVNRVFISSTGLTGTFGGLAQADDFCTTKAGAAGIPGTFRAFLSTSTVNARDRFAGSRGWMRVDDEPVVDTIEAMVNGKLYNPLTIDENGATVDPNVVFVWTGTGGDGRTDISTCADWTNGASGRSGETDATIPRVFYGGMAACSVFNYRFYCFEVGHAVVQGPRVTAGRVAFTSSPAGAVTTMAALDGHCQTEATAAGLGGTFLAALATKTASIQQRFTADARPWIRPDGTVVASTFAALFDATHLTSYVNQHADGTYAVATEFVNGGGAGTNVGTTSSTCNDWAGTNGAPTLGNTISIRKDRFWANNMVGSATGDCTALPSLLCLEQ